MKITNLQQAEAALAAFAPPPSHITTKDITLDRLRPFMPLIGNPQDRLRVVHIAGTSGKTSTAYYTAALLAAAGKKTGLAVSPHIDTILERIQINGRNVSEADFCSELSVFLELAQAARPRPSYFEVFHAFTLWYMERQGVFYVVVETGVGGLHDATNINARPDKVAVITDIGFDHTELLGKTLPAITAQKIGIVHEGNNVFIYKQADEVMAVVEQWTKDHRAPLHITTEAAQARAYGSDLDAMPDYQRRNWLLAHAVYAYLQQRDDLPNVTRQALRKTQQLQVPGRMDVRTYEGKTLVMDGAHNPQKMAAFMTSFQSLHPGVRPAVLIALKEGKEYQALVPLLVPLAARIITTTFKTTQDLPAVSMDPGILARAFHDAGVEHTESISDNREAFRALLSAPENLCVITGSFYLLGQIRNNEHLA